jgi:MoaA/NifB/PqqE/SkfB family radical SAM enzyme
MQETVIHWTLNNYCAAQCDYCPTHSRGGLEPHETADYIRITNLLIEHYTKTLNRQISWVINGGEPLDTNDIAVILKLFKTNGKSVTLHTNGGRLWMDWWALEPYVDHLILTFHYWQNPALIKYIVQTFTAKNKPIQLTAPIRPSHVKEDLARVERLEQEMDYKISKTLLYINGDPSAGLLRYNEDDLRSIDKSNGTLEEGVSSLDQKDYYDSTTWDDRYNDTYTNNPVYSGQYCNAGIERLYIDANGWVMGSTCNNISLGNIFKSFNAPQGPQKCGMLACVNSDDQQITKFPLGDL